MNIRKRIKNNRGVSFLLVLITLITLLGSCGDTTTESNTNQTTIIFNPDSETSLVPGDSETEDTSETSETSSGEVSLDLGGYAVSSASAEATEAGMKVLANGGNAVDAACTVALVLGVTEPYSSGLGGGGYMLIYDPTTEESISIDYYASSGSSEEKINDIGLPGLLKGVDTALKEYGTISLAEAIAPAIDYAENGFTCTETFMTRLSYSESLQNNPAYAGLEKGDTIVQTELAETLKKIQSEGISAFYEGEIASDICDAAGFSLDDLKNYQVYISSGLKTDAFGFDLYATNAPSSGVVTLQLLKLCDMLDIPSPSQDSKGYLDVLKKATLAAFTSRSRKLVDPRHYEFDSDELLSEEYLNRLLEDVNMMDSFSINDDKEGMCTTQFSCIDSSGMIVSVTDTLSNNWGSYKQVDGFYLNNTLSVFGYNEVTGYAAWKRPKSYISPIIAVHPDGFCVAIGSPGGENIPRSVAGVLMEILTGNTDVQTAIDKARCLFDEEGRLVLETTDEAESIIDESVVDNYEHYYSSSHIYFGCTSVVGYSPTGGVFACSDMRRKTSSGQAYNE